MKTLLLALTLSLLCAGIAEAGHPLLGLNLGTSFYSHDGATKATTTVTGDGASLIPGLRIGYTDDQSSFEGTIDLSGIFEPERGGQPHQYDYSLLASVDDAMKTWDTTSLFITAGIGYQHFDRDLWTLGRETYGAGAGFRRAVADDRGALRFEVRWDHAPEREFDQGAVFVGTPIHVVLPAVDAVSIKLGFDLRIF